MKGVLTSPSTSARSADGVQSAQAYSFEGTRPGKTLRPSPLSRFGPHTKHEGQRCVSSGHENFFECFASEGVGISIRSSCISVGIACATSCPPSSNRSPSNPKTRAIFWSIGIGLLIVTSTGPLKYSARVPAVYPPCPEFFGPQNRLGMIIESGLNNSILPNIRKPRTVLPSYIFTLIPQFMVFVRKNIPGG